MSSAACAPSRPATTLSFEVMPPRHPDRAPKFWNCVDNLITARPDFVSVTYGAAGRDRDTARDVATRIVREAPVHPIAHLTCVGTARAEVANVISDYLDSGVRTFLALRGDPPVGNPDWHPAADAPQSAVELIRLIRQIEDHRIAHYPGAALRAAYRPLTIAVATFPAGNPAAGTSPEQEAERLLVKQAAGADFAVTQLFFEPDTYLSFVDKARAIGVTIPIVAGILPPTDPARLRRTQELTGIEAPRFLMDDLSRAADEAELQRTGIRHGASLAAEILEGGAPGLHIYTFNKFQPALGLLREVGLLEESSIDEGAGASTRPTPRTGPTDRPLSPLTTKES